MTEPANGPNGGGPDNIGVGVTDGYVTSNGVYNAFRTWRFSGYAKFSSQGGGTAPYGLRSCTPGVRVDAVRLIAAGGQDSLMLLTGLWGK